MIITRASHSEVAQIALLHIEAFPGFFLTSMGLPFLKELYTGFLSHPSGVLLVAKDGEHLVGFAAGTSAPKIFFPELRRKRGAAFLLRAIPSILRNPLPVCRKLLYARRYRGEAAKDETSGALLSSIGVATSYRGLGVAAGLIATFETEMVQRGAKSVYLTTDSEKNDRVMAFYRKSGYTAISCFKQTGGRKMFRYEKLLSA